jgi:hypothetical protein
MADTTAKAIRVAPDTNTAEAGIENSPGVLHLAPTLGSLEVAPKKILD